MADCIVNYLDEGGKQPFQSPNIWHQEYSMTYVQALFGKPNPTLDTTLDEYNKFFRQPMKMLSAAGILSEKGISTIQFSVENMDALRFISLRERNSYDFLCAYIEKTLKDSGIWLCLSVLRMMCFGTPASISAGWRSGCPACRTSADGRLCYMNTGHILSFRSLC